MEGVILDSAALNFVSAFAALVILAFAFAGILLGYIADRERGGDIIHWSAEPIPGTGEAEGGREIETRRAA